MDSGFQGRKIKISWLSDIKSNMLSRFTKETAKFDDVRRWRVRVTRFSSREATSHMAKAKKKMYTTCLDSGGVWKSRDLTGCFLNLGESYRWCWKMVPRNRQNDRKKMPKSVPPGWYFDDIFHIASRCPSKGNQGLALLVSVANWLFIPAWSALNLNGMKSRYPTCFPEIWFISIEKKLKKNILGRFKKKQSHY